MSKLGIFLIILLLIFIGLPFLYIFYEPSQEPMANFFGSIVPLFTGGLIYLDDFFRSLWFGLALLLGIGILLGIVLDRRAHAIYYGIRRRFARGAIQDAYGGGTGLQTQPTYNPQVVPKQPGTDLEKKEEGG